MNEVLFLIVIGPLILMVTAPLRRHERIKKANARVREILAGTVRDDPDADAIAQSFGEICRRAPEADPFWVRKILEVMVKEGLLEVTRREIEGYSRADFYRLTRAGIAHVQSPPPPRPILAATPRTQ